MVGMVEVRAFPLSQEAQESESRSRSSYTDFDSSSSRKVEEVVDEPHTRSKTSCKRTIEGQLAVVSEKKQ